MKMEKYFNQAKLMLSVLPIVGQEENFALKGGTALNFFHLKIFMVEKYVLLWIVNILVIYLISSSFLRLVT